MISNVKEKTYNMIDPQEHNSIVCKKKSKKFISFDLVILLLEMYQKKIIIGLILYGTDMLMSNQVFYSVILVREYLVRDILFHLLFLK